MFRKIRRSDKAKTGTEAAEIMKAGTNGILSVNGDDGYPYGVPVSYVYHEGSIYFHTAREGHKIESIKKDPRVSFCVVGADNIQPDKFTTMYSSAICFGRARIVEDDDEKQRILEMIVERYSKDFREAGMKYIKAQWNDCHTVAIDVEYMTGKGLA